MQIDQGSSWKTADHPTTKIKMIRFAFFCCLGRVRVLVIIGEFLKSSIGGVAPWAVALLPRVMALRSQGEERHPPDPGLVGWLVSSIDK